MLFGQIINYDPLTIVRRRLGHITAAGDKVEKKTLH